MISSEVLTENIEGLAIGIRFNPTFAIQDNLGKIADMILYSKKSYFNPQFFPLVTSAVNQVALRDDPDSPTRLLSISATDIILDVKKRTDVALEPLMLEGEFKQQFFNSVLKEYPIRDIQRIGCLTKYRIRDKQLSDAFCAKSGVDANNFSLRFQKNYPMPSSMAKKDVNDYCSNIYTIVKNADLDELILHSDYQIYFKPFLDDYEDLNYDSFIASKNQFNQSDLVSWINRYLGR